MSADRAGAPAPPWTTTRWFNSDPLTLDDLRGRVVVLEAFQMLCPSCVSHALPQATRLVDTFGPEVAVIGLHTVFEHHEAMTDVSLQVFLQQYGIRFPVGVDAHQGLDPVTFTRYGMRGTPSTVIIDRDGLLRGHHIGTINDMGLAAVVATFVERGAADTAPA